MILFLLHGKPHLSISSSFSSIIGPICWQISVNTEIITNIETIQLKSVSTIFKQENMHHHTNYREISLCQRTDNKRSILTTFIAPLLLYTTIIDQGQSQN